MSVSITKKTLAMAMLYVDTSATAIRFVKRNNAWTVTALYGEPSNA